MRLFTMVNFDLTDRTRNFGINIVIFCKQYHSDSFLKPLIIQLLRSGTSVGANYCEANDAYSSKDFLHRLVIVKKEIKEAIYWFILLRSIIQTKALQELYDEALELNLIFSSSIKKIRFKKN